MNDRNVAALEAKAAKMTSPGECDGWITQSRKEGDEQKAQVGIARKYQITQPKR